MPDLAGITVCDEVSGGGKFGCMVKKPAPTIRDLYPHFTDEQLAEAEDAHDRYLTIVLRIFERLESEGRIQVGQLTADAGAIPCEVSASAAS